MGHSLEIDADRLLKNILTLAEIGKSGGKRHRVTFSPAYEEARSFVAQEMRYAGLDVCSDAAGNLIGRLGPPGACIMCGSHIDTVPDGGPLDGAYGVLAGISCAAALNSSTSHLPIALEVVAFADEEGHYVDCLGSSAMMGDLDEDVLDRQPANGLKAAMRRAGFEPDRIGEAARTQSDIQAYLELHIEQGPVLEANNVPVGVVEGIVGIARRDFEFHGEAAHAGTTPMQLRHDAFAAVADFAHFALDRLVEEGGPDARVTFGIVELRPGATNVVPSNVRIRQELRHPSSEKLKALGATSEKIAVHAANVRGCNVEICTCGGHEPIPLSGKIQQIVEVAAHKLNFQTLRLPSGAGHDAQILAPFVPAGMIFVPSEGGRSHRSDEWTDPEHLKNGANVLLHSLLALFKEGAESVSFNRI